MIRNFVAVRRIALVLVAVVLLVGCGGSIPSIPNTPESIIAKGDAYFADKKFFKAAELYKAFLERHPGHDRADYAQFRLGESYFGDEQYPLAAVEYRIVVANYGYSEWVDDALFKTGVCYWKESPKPARDQRKTEEAIDMFRQFILSYPTSELVPQANEFIAKANSKLAEKVLVTVKWYVKRKRFRAARIYCDKIIDNYPDNPSWAEAMFYKATILTRSGENDEAAELLRRVVSYPGDLDIKSEAQARLRELAGP